MSKKKEFKRIAENARLEAGMLMTSKQITSCNAIIHTAAKSILGAAAATLIGTTAARSVLKFIPVAGWIASAAVAAAVTEALGWSIANDFASQYRKNYEIQREKERAEETIKAEKRKMEEEFANYMNDMDDSDDI